MQQEKIKHILAEMQRHLREVERLSREAQSDAFENQSPTQAQQLIERLEIPPLEVLDDKKSVRKKQ